jgi:hypothetical protein
LRTNDVVSNSLCADKLLSGYAKHAPPVSLQKRKSEIPIYLYHSNVFFSTLGWAIYKKPLEVSFDASSGGGYYPSGCTVWGENYPCGAA